MNRAKVNFVIDALMFLCMMTIAGLGFLMKYILLPGREGVVKYGRRVELSLLGLDRHDWGAIHLYLAFLLLALLALHIILHWNMIPGLFARLVTGVQQRWVVAILFLEISAALLLFPFLISPNVKDSGIGEGRRYGNQQSSGMAAYSAVFVAKNDLR